MIAGTVKAFDERLAEWSSRAERELRTWLRKHGYEYTHLPNGQYGCDGLAENSFERFYVDVERVGQERWPGEAFPHPTYNVLERRAEKMRSGAVLFACQHDVRRAFVVFSTSLIPERLKRIYNPLCEGECAYQVPLYECCPIDLTDGGGEPIAVLNAKRVRSRAREAVSPKARLMLLHDWPPYGMAEDEWRELRDSAEEPIRQIAFCGCATDRTLWVDTGRDERGWVRTECRTCRRVIGFRPQ